MIRFLLRISGICAAMLLILAIVMLQLVDRSPYETSEFYREMNTRLDSLASQLQLSGDSSIRIGWSKINITPEVPVPLAGYGARDPLRLQGIHDSSFVRTIVLKTRGQKIAIITADLLIIHPEVSQAVRTSLPEDWDPDDLYFTATHTHSGQGAWAPGAVGQLFAGKFDPQHVRLLAERILESVHEAELSARPGSFSVGEMEVSHLVRNRLVKENGIIDPWLKALAFQKDSLKGILAFYSAHATCFGVENHDLSGDYPAQLTQMLEAEEAFDFAAYAAGAVGSMAPDVELPDGEKSAVYMAYHLKDQLELFQRIGLSPQPPIVTTFRLKLPMRAPQFKISENMALRPYLFQMAFGDYQNHVAVMVLGKCIFIGMPCDFSGELAVPLYEQARELGYQLVISSFNGDYAGYVIRDKWYDLPRYEARTMSWYGHDAGSYLSEVTSRIIHIVDEAYYQADSARR